MKESILGCHKESHKEEVLASIYFSIIRKIEVEGKKGETFLVPHAGNGSKDSK